MQDRLLSFITTGEGFQRQQTDGVKWWALDDWAEAGKAYNGMWPGQEFWPQGEWRDLYAQGYRYCAFVRDGRSLAMAGLWPRSEREWEVIAVGTAPTCRSRGYAKAVVTFVTDEILSHGRSATITTRCDNIPMLRVIDYLGFRPKDKGEQVRTEPTP